MFVSAYMTLGNDWAKRIFQNAACVVPRDQLVRQIGKSSLRHGSHDVMNEDFHREPRNQKESEVVGAIGQSDTGSRDP